MRKLLLVMLGVALTAGVSVAAVAKDYKIAVTDIQGMDALISEWGPFKEALEKATGHSFEFFPVTSQTATAEALRSKKLDFAITGPAEYVAINKLTDADAMIGLARPDYYCGIVVKNARHQPCIRPQGQVRFLRQPGIDLRSLLPDAGLNGSRH